MILLTKSSWQQNDQNRLTIAAAQNLAAAINMKKKIGWLDLTFKQLEPGALGIVVSSLTQCPIKSFYLNAINHNPKDTLSDSDVNALCEFIAKSSSLILETSLTLKSISLHNHAIEANDLELLLTRLTKKKNNVLEELTLSSSPLGEIGLDALAKYVKSPTCKLVNIDIGSTKLTDDCAESLFSIINGNTQLKTLLCGTNSLSIIKWQPL